MGASDGTTVTYTVDNRTWDTNTAIDSNPHVHRVWIPATGYYISASSNFFTNWEVPVQLKSTQYGVIALNGSTVVSVHDSEAEASSAAGRLAAKDGNEYLVIKPLKIVRQKPVDIEEVTV